VITYRDISGWSALADRTRRAIVATLAEGPRAVGELAAEMPVTRPAVSQHLKVLREAGLVSEHQEGTRHIYQLNPIALAALRDQLDTYWRRALTNYTETLSDDTDERGDPAQRKESHDSDPSDRTPARRRRLTN
jgi:DNA-binding transcriptional ArsR family regulator